MKTKKNNKLQIVSMNSGSVSPLERPSSTDEEIINLIKIIESDEIAIDKYPNWRLNIYEIDGYIRMDVLDPSLTVVAIFYVNSAKKTSKIAWEDAMQRYKNYLETVKIVELMEDIEPLEKDNSDLKRPKDNRWICSTVNTVHIDEEYFEDLISMMMLLYEITFTMSNYLMKMRIKK